MKNVFFFIVITLSLMYLACEEQKTPLRGETMFQKTLNAHFKDASVSPLKEHDLKTFKGLEFFPVDSSYVVKAKIDRTLDTTWLKTRTTTDRIAEQRLYGVLNFTLKGKNFKLHVYQPKEYVEIDSLNNTLFLPFLDNTNGESSYDAGRYIDIEDTLNDSLTIDFNKAYNPYCAYNEKYSCPIVPRVNYLNIDIEAGVKSWKND